MDRATLHPWIEAAHAAADAAGATVRGYHRASFEVDAKADDTLVTTADLATERAMRDVLLDATPSADIHGEEYPPTGESSDWRWVLDPIDGTIAFACGKPLFTTLIGLLHRGEAVLGVIDQPVTGDRWVGDPWGTRLGSRDARVRGPVPLDRARVTSTAPDCLTPGIVQALASGCGVVSWGGDAYNYGALASGSVDVVVERGLAPHDYAALVPVVEGAGGRITDWSGASLRRVDGPRDVLATTHADLHAAMLELIRAQS